MRTSTTSHGWRNTRRAIAPREMTRVVENQIPTTPATINAAVTLTVNQPPLGLTRSVLRPPTSDMAGIPTVCICLCDRVNDALQGRAACLPPSPYAQGNGNKRGLRRITSWILFQRDAVGPMRPNGKTVHPTYPLNDRSHLPMPAS